MGLLVFAEPRVVFEQYHFGEFGDLGVQGRLGRFEETADVEGIRLLEIGTHLFRMFVVLYKFQVGLVLHYLGEVDVDVVVLHLVLVA
jgi:hypothetical protein